ncbi:hypothetical protein [Burkholderia ubonensis]|uniref:hypothetical protein n=1 Tax=Burkholderia ubonensis TaxID=101571 RepID=UPI0012F7F904|nr:hypothetical protein [Burkholderia ubonensis]
MHLDHHFLSRSMIRPLFHSALDNQLCCIISSTDLREGSMELTLPAVLSTAHDSSCCARRAVFLRTRERLFAVVAHFSARPWLTVLPGLANDENKDKKIGYGRIGLRRFWAPLRYTEKNNPFQLTQACEIRLLNTCTIPSTSVFPESMPT